jgi:kynurenine formamidase
LPQSRHPIIRKIANPACALDDPQRARDAAGVDLRPKDMVLLEMNFTRAATSVESFLTDFPGLTKESATWLGKQGIAMLPSMRQYQVEAS